MAVRRGTATPSKAYRGTVAAKKAYRGAVEMWSASAYPASGSWQATLTATGVTYAAHTVSESGTYAISHTVTGAGQYTVAYIRGPLSTNSVQGDVGPPSTASTTRALAVGDVIEFRANSLSPSGNSTGSWSITKN